MATSCSRPKDNSVAYMEFIAYVITNNNFKAKSIIRAHENLVEFHVDDSGKTLLHVSARYGNATITQFLIHHYNYQVNVRDDIGETPLMLVPARASCVAKILLDAGACMHMRDFQGTSALERLVKNCRAEWSPLLTNRGILRVFYDKLKRDNGDKRTIAKQLCNANCPLPVVILLNDVELTRSMLEVGCALDERAHGMTALHVAVQLADWRNVEFLLEYGANVNELDRSQETPICKYRVETDDTSDKCQVLKMLLDRGASLDVMVTREFGYRESIVRRLLTSGRKRTISMLVENIDLSMRYGSSGQTALHFLVQNRVHRRAVENGIQLMIGKNVDVNVRDKKGRTALTIAVSNGFTSTVEFLVANGAKATVTQILEKTPMMRELVRDNDLRDYEDSTTAFKHYLTVLRLILRYNLTADDFQYCNQAKNNLMLLKFAMAYVVIDERIDEKSLAGSANTTVKSRPILCDFYDCCKRQFDAIVDLTIHGTVTVYKLLTDSDEKLVNYACNQALIVDFQSFMQNISTDDSCYRYILQKRIDRAIEIAKLREDAATAICKLTGLPENQHRHIANQIARYMSSHDFRMLFQVVKIA